MRLGASTPAYGCSFPGRVDTLEALVRLLLRLRTIRDLHKERWRLLEETIDYEDVGRLTTTTTSARSTLDQAAPTLLLLLCTSGGNDL